MNLKLKILLPAVFSIVLSVSFGVYFIYHESVIQIENEFLQSSKNIVNVSMKMVSTHVESLKNIVLIESENTLIKKFIAEKNSRDANYEFVNKQISDLPALFNSIDQVFIAEADGDLIMTTRDKAAKVNMSDRKWFKEAIGGRTVISEPLISKTYGVPVIQICTPIYDNGAVIGVIGASIVLDRFTDAIVSQARIGVNGYLMLATDKGAVFSHPDTEKILKLDISKYDWGADILSNKVGQIHFNLDNMQKTAVYLKDEVTKWTIVAVIDDDDAFRVVKHSRNISLLIATACIVLSASTLIYGVKRILGDLTRIIEFAEKVSLGFLDEKLSIARKDELGVLANALFKMVDTLKNRLKEVEEKTIVAEQEAQHARRSAAEAENAKVMAENARYEGQLQAANKLSSVVDIVSDESDQLALQINDSSSGAEEQSSRIQNVASSIEEINSTIAEVANNSMHAAKCADQVKVKAEQGAAIVENVGHSVRHIQSSSSELKGDMHLLMQQVDGIGEILNVISDIADQTNLLALNAAIEAARAGDSGRGFAVVANEVRKLAEKTMKATKDIEDVICGIQDETKKNCFNVDKISNIIEEVTDMSSTSGEALHEIVLLAQEASDQVKIIAASSSEQTTASEMISDTICTINQISIETTERMRNSTQGIEKLTHQAGVLRSLINDLTNSAK